jgi:lipopolysaccharide transport system ATP-binding protein
MPDHAVAITCQGVSKRFALIDHGSAWRLALNARANVPIFEALHDVGLEVPKGQFVGVLGRNGAGKSTLLRVLGGVYSADEGRVAVTGALSGLYELGVVGNQQLTGRAYAERLLTVHGFSRRERGPMISDIHDFSELGDRFDDPVLTYSAGMTARLFFSTSTAGRYKVYLIDEILSVGDQHFQAKCWRRLRDRVSRGASGVLVTHDWSAIVRMCETAHVLERGRITFSGPAERAVRLYLYGEAAREAYQEEITRFVSVPTVPIEAKSGVDLNLTFRAEILLPAEVGCVFVIERLQRGFGWETALMSRGPSPVGTRPGIYDIDVLIEGLPLDPGSYQIGVSLVAPNAKMGGRFVTVLAACSWLNGNGLTLNVTGEPDKGIPVPLRWRAKAGEAVSA